MLLSSQEVNVKALKVLVLLLISPLAQASGCYCLCFQPCWGCCIGDHVNAYCDLYVFSLECEFRCQTKNTWNVHGRCPQVVREGGDTSKAQQDTCMENEEHVQLASLSAAELSELLKSASKPLRAPFAYSVVMKKNDVLRSGISDNIALSALMAFTAGSINGEPDGGTLEFGFPVVDQIDVIRDWFNGVSLDPTKFSTHDLVGWVDPSGLRDGELRIHILPLDRTEILRTVVLRGKHKLRSNGESRDFAVGSISVDKLPTPAK
jgi:hypothetical protein